MDKKEFNLLLPAITLIVIITGFLFALKVLMPKVAENQARIKAVNTDIAKAEAKLDSLRTAQSSMTKLSDVVNNILIAVPDSIDSPNLIVEIEAIASANKVGIASLSPPTDRNSGDINSSGSLSTGEESSSGLSVTVSAVGSFQDINNFISGIESSIRFSKITALTITSSQEGPLSVSISFDVYKRPVVSSSKGGTK